MIWEWKNKGGFIPVIKSSRAYPFGSLAKVTIGRVEVKDDSIIPLNGIEFAFNEYLQGTPGKELTQEISGKVLVPKKSEHNILSEAGKDVVTTINIEFQEAAEQSLREKMEDRIWNLIISPEWLTAARIIPVGSQRFALTTTERPTMALIERR